MPDYTDPTVSGYRRAGGAPAVRQSAEGPRRAHPSTRVAHTGRVRPRWALGVFGYTASLGLIAALLVEPSGLRANGLFAVASESITTAAVQAQQMPVVDVVVDDATRDGFDVVRARPSYSAPAAGAPDPGSAKATASELVTARGWGQGEYDCLVALWNRESHWNVYAYNARSGAYGIPQALPGTKMASAGADWATNAATQITWGIGYIAARYGTPCGAWGHSQLMGWY